MVVYKLEARLFHFLFLNCTLKVRYKTFGVQFTLRQPLIWLSFKRIPHPRTFVKCQWEYSFLYFRPFLKKEKKHRLLVFCKTVSDDGFRFFRECSAFRLSYFTYFFQFFFFDNLDFSPVNGNQAFRRKLGKSTDCIWSSHVRQVCQIFAGKVNA